MCKFHDSSMDSLGRVADKGPLYMYMKEMVWGEISQIKIASAHIHILRNNPAKFHNSPMDSLGGVADNRFRPTDKGMGRKDKGNLVCPASLKWRGIKKVIASS